MFSFLLHLLQISFLVCSFFFIHIFLDKYLLKRRTHNIAVNNPWLSDLHNISLAVYLIELNKKSDHHVKRHRRAAAQHNIRAQFYGVLVQVEFLCRFFFCLGFLMIVNEWELGRTI
jgi:hypothetical protein